MAHLISLLIALVTGIHRTLYFPTLTPLPVVRPVEFPDQSNLVLPVARLDATPHPQIAAGSYLVIDGGSGEVLMEKQADSVLPPASTTKIMTAMVVLEQLDLKKIIKVPSDLEHEGSVMDLVPDEQITVESLLSGMLISSSNDAALLLARSIPGGEAVFVTRMNRKARELGMMHTHFNNASGLYDSGHTTTVRDLLILSRYAMQNYPIFRQIVGKKSAVLTSVDGSIIHKVETTNKLLGVIDGIEGIKTGYTQESGECLVTSVTRQGHTIYTAMLGSQDRFGETQKLIDWVFSNFAWVSKPLDEW